MALIVIINVQAAPMANPLWKKTFGQYFAFIVAVLISQMAFGRSRALLAQSSTSGQTALPANVTKAIYESLGELIDLLEPYVDSKGLGSGQTSPEERNAIYASAEDIRDATHYSNHSSNLIANAISQAPYGQVIIEQVPQSQPTAVLNMAAMAPTQAVAAAGAPTVNAFLNAGGLDSPGAMGIISPSFRQGRRSRARQTPSDSSLSSLDPKALEAAAHEAAQHPSEGLSNQHGVQGTVASDGPADAKDHYWWAGLPISRGTSGDSHASSNNDIHSISDLQNLDDQQLAQIFADGEPDIPGGLPDSRGARPLQCCNFVPLLNPILILHSIWINERCCPQTRASDHSHHCPSWGGQHLQSHRSFAC